MKTILVENAEYRIVKFVASEDSKVLCNDFYINWMRCRFRLDDAAATLEKRVGLFWSFWKRIEYTNIAYVVEEWMCSYFTGIHLKNGQTKSS